MRPAISQFTPHVLEVCISHIVYIEDENIRVLLDADADIGVEAEGKVFTLFGYFGEVNYFGALGLGHSYYGLGVRSGVEVEGGAFGLLRFRTARTFFGLGIMGYRTLAVG